MAEDLGKKFLVENNKVNPRSFEFRAKERANFVSVHEVGEILKCHEALFSSIKTRDYLKSAVGLSDRDAHLLEVKVIRQSLSITRSHGIPQASLKSAVRLSKLANMCVVQGINVEGATKFDLANVLWDQGEMAASIRMLQQLDDQGDLHKQAIPISRPELLVTLVSGNTFA